MMKNFPNRQDYLGGGGGGGEGERMIQCDLTFCDQLTTYIK